MWMSKGAYDVSALVVNFLGSDWWPKHMTIGLFKTTKTTSEALAVNLVELLNKYGLWEKNCLNQGWRF